MATLESKLKLTLVDSVSSKMKPITSSISGLQRQVAAAGAPMAGVVGKLVAFGGSYVGVTAAMNGAFKPAMAFQAALSEIQIKANLSGDQVANLKAQLLKLAPATNQTVDAMTTGMDTMVGMGLATDQAAAALPAIGKAATATGATMDALSSSAVAAIQNLKVAPGEVGKMLDGMATAGNAGAFELRDMAQYFPQLSASAQSLGMHGVGAVNDLAAALQIARRGAGDASTAANNASDFLSKVNNPQTVKNLKKMGVDVQKVLANASKKGVSPIEAMITTIDKVTKGGKNELLTQIFGDKQALDFTRAMIAGFKDYVSIRDQANNGNGTIDKSFTLRMDNAAEKLKGFKIRMDELGMSIGDKLLGPASDAAKKLTEILDSLGQRATPIDQMTTAISGFTNGLGLSNKASLTDQVADALLGKADGSAAADRLGQVFGKFQGWGRDVKELWDQIKDNKLVKFIEDLSPTVSKWFAIAVGVSFAATSITSLASALLALTGASTVLKLLKGLGGLAGVPGLGDTPIPGGKPNGKPGGLLDGAPAAVPLLTKLGTWLKGFGGNTVIGAIPQILGDTPGDTFKEQVANQAQYRQDLLNLFGMDDPRNKPKGPAIPRQIDTDGLRAAVDGANAPARLGEPVSKFGPSLTAINNAIDRANAVARALPKAPPPVQPSAPLAGMTYERGTGFHTVAPTAEPINAASIASAIGGTQLSVRVTNPPPPVNAPVNVTINVNGAQNPGATAQAVKSAFTTELGATLRAQRQSAFTDQN